MNRSQRKRFGLGTLIATILGAAAVFYIANRASEHIRAEIAAGGSIGDLLNTFPGALLADVWFVSTDQLDLLIGGGGALLIVLIVLYVYGATKSTRPGEEQGSAAWGGPRDIARFRDKSPARELKFSTTESLSVDTRKTRRNLNVLVLGASGTGKTRSYVMPNLTTLDASSAVTDPKGEIMRSAEAGLRARGHQVRSLNLIDLKQSGRYNPFWYFNPNEPETSIAQLAECIIANTSGKESKGDAFWERAERALLTALIAMEWTGAPYDEDEAPFPTLPGVLDIQKGMGGSEENKDQRDSPTDILFAAARDAIELWKEDPTQFRDEDQDKMKVLDYACRQYRLYEQGPVETRLSVVISLGVRLAPLDMHDVREILSGDDMGIDRLGFEKTTLFLQIPDTHGTFKFISAMFWQSVFEHTVYQADHQPDGLLPVMVHAFLDEFANIGMIPNFERVIATIRSRGLSVSIIMQSHSQGKSMFREDWETIEGNCDTIVFLGSNELTTKEWMSKQLGNETITMQETSQSYGMNGSWSKNTRTVKRLLMEPDEVGRLDNAYAIIMIRGLRPFMSRKTAA
ncbi:MAG: VirD4-like conjugal transfer protein, CD1115 family [Microbacterium sp.]|uniref:VirD4-like conjugal transfer protein, CD1115 family n=1 Tax=Microbacterium sp. TaxID=51671 RepID=UPI003F98DC87